MHGPDFERPSTKTVEILKRASTATLTSILRRKGFHNATIYMPLRPLFAGSRMVGPALTIRCVPGRNDLEAAVREEGTLFPRHPDDAMDSVQPGDVVVQDGQGSMAGGIFGDLLTLRIKMKGAVGLVCDMAVRDLPHLAETELPIFCPGAVSPGSMMFSVDYNVPIGCAGVLVLPGDIISGDADGVVVIPQAAVDEVVEEILLFEEREDFIRLMLAKGHSQRGLYPMGPEMEERFQEWRAAKGGAADG